MKTISLASLVALIGLFIWGCNPSQNVTPSTDLSTARLASDTTGFHCRQNLTKIDVSALPAAVTNAISASYAGATINYAAKDDAGNFLVAITQNSQRKTLLFNADGTFNRELALRGGPGGHGPGRGRDSLTQVAVTALPAAITNYINTNYAGATINVAAQDPNRGYVVMITLNSQRKTLVFDLNGAFVQEVVRGLKGNYTAIDASTLPANVTSYITTNYAGATIKVAGKNTTGQYKVVIQTTDNRLVELTFAADGTFVQARSGRR